MPPIKVHIDDPITPQKQQSDNTAAQQAETTQDQPSPYPAARPGAAAVPAPTPYAPNPQYQPPTRTTPSSNYDGPPPPQPGAVPVPPSQQVPMTASSPLPPPPKAGEKAPVTTMPPQMNVPPPQQNYTPTRGTMYSPPEHTSTGPTTLNFGAVPAPAPAAAQHPPGYQQNVNAQEMSSAARASLDAQDRGQNSAYNRNDISLGGDGASEMAGNVWNTVKGWASAAGTSLAETEKEVWKRINRD